MDFTTRQQESTEVHCQGIGGWYPEPRMNTTHDFAGFTDREMRGLMQYQKLEALHEARGESPTAFKATRNFPVEDRVSLNGPESEPSAMDWLHGLSSNYE